MIYSFSKLRESNLLAVFTICIRYLLGGSFVHASIFKIQGKRFTPESGESAPIDSLFHFFETLYQSGLYWNFIGWGQLIAGFFLISQKFSTLGAVMFFPIMLNIFVITLSFDSLSIQAITLLMLIANSYLLLWDWNRLKFIVLPVPGCYRDYNSEFSKKWYWTFLGLLLFFAIVVFRIL